MKDFLRSIGKYRNTSLFFILMLLISTNLVSCANYASPQNLDELVIHMNKDDVLKKMNFSGISRGSILTESGKVVEVREYQIFQPFVGTHAYWLYFSDGKLAKWGQAGDWADAQKFVYDVNFNTSK